MTSEDVPMELTFLYHGGRPEIKFSDYVAVTVSPMVSVIKSRAFSSWTKLQSIEFLDDSLQRIEYRAFQYCGKLIKIRLPDTIQGVGIYAFAGCRRLRSINLPKEIVGIGEFAFMNCTSLTRIILPPLITTIARHTFENCISLSKVVIPPSVKELGPAAFVNCRSLRSVILSEQIQYINVRAFRGTKLQSIQIPPSVNVIDDNVFEGCTSLRVIYVKGTAILHAESAFDGCSNIVVLSDDDDFEHATIQEHVGFPVLTLEQIQECVDDLPPNYIPPNEQLQKLHNVLQQRYPDVAQQTKISGLNLLHLLVYFPGAEIYPILSKVLEKCPQATVTVDMYGKTPLHHVIASTWPHFDIACYNLLLKKCERQVIHRAIESGAAGMAQYDEVRDIVDLKVSGLIVQDEKSGLLPFQMAAEGSSALTLTAVYELLSLQPDVIKMYNVS